MDELERFQLTPGYKRLLKESIDLGMYERQRDRLREELPLVEIDRHGSKVEEFDAELRSFLIGAIAVGLLLFLPAGTLNYGKRGFLSSSF